MSRRSRNELQTAIENLLQDDKPNYSIKPSQLASILKDVIDSYLVLETDWDTVIYPKGFDAQMYFKKSAYSQAYDWEDNVSTLVNAELFQFYKMECSGSGLTIEVKSMLDWTFESRLRQWNMMQCISVEYTGADDSGAIAWTFEDDTVEIYANVDDLQPIKTFGVITEFWLRYDRELNRIYVSKSEGYAKIL